MSFIAMDLLGEYPEMENGSHYALTIICMLTLFVNIIPIKDKKTEIVINAYIKSYMQTRGDQNFSSVIMEKNSLVPQWHTLQTN